MSKQLSRQGGGTLLGLIMGLVIGLSIAVVVAITIKNTPLPFTNKLGRPEKAPDAASAVADPNRTLRGNKDAAREAARQSAKPAEEKPAEAASEAKEAARAAAKEPAADKESAKVAAKDATREAPKAIAKGGENKAPVVDKSITIDGRSKEPGAAADEKFTYYLQAGAFLEQADAENTKAKLALMGVGAGIAERKSDNGTLYRVRIGPFAQLEAMNRVRSKLTDNGVDVAVVRVPK
jgi:cell division protein FtsN